MSDTFNAIADLKGHAGQPVSLLPDGRVTLAFDSAFPAIGLGTETVGTIMTGTASAVAVIISAYLSGTIENGPNNGNIVLKFRSEVNNSLVTVKRGSWCRFYKH